jgi:Rhs element Vgr protein
MTTRLLPIEQNTDLITYSIQVNGAPLPAHFPLHAIEAFYETNKIPLACVYFSDGDAATGEWTLSSEEYFVPGNEITVLAGYHGEEEPIFSGIVVGQSLRVRNARFELKVTCKDKAVALTTVKKSRHFVEMTDSDALAEIVADYELQVGEIATTTVTHTDLVQYDACDWDFIVMRSEANGLVCIADDKGLNVVKPSMDSAAIATIQFGTNVIEFDGDIDARRQIGSVSAQSWDPAAQGYALADSSDSGWKVNGNLDATELAASVGADTQKLQHGGAVPVEELQQWSNASLLRSRMAFVRGRVRVQGFSTVKPGTVIELDGFGDRFNGPVWVSAVRHEVGQGNWLSDIEFGLSEEWHARRYQASALPANGLLAAVSGLHIAVVTALAGDPLNESRIRVKIPSVQLEGEGLWARVSTLDAGSSRGSSFLPEIDDEVLVGFLNDDPRHPVVLGMLHSSSHAPPQEASDENHIKGFYSRSGMRLLFDDESSILTLDTPAGHIVTMDDEAGEVSLTDSNNNKILMDSSGITIESAGDLILKASGNVTAEGQTNLELKAGAQFTAEGSAGVEVNSSAITVIKGSLVQIN